MSTRRSTRPPRSRKLRASEPPQSEVLLTQQAAPATPKDPTETGQLRALEAGWDELLT